MTIFEKINSMNIDEMASWLSCLSYYDDTLWLSWWEDTFCKDCYAEMVQIEEGKWIPCTWCELNDKCRCFPEIDDIPSDEDVIRMWLESEYE